MSQAFGEPKSRGISRTDVWNAADALLLEGARPTIERVRHKIGRGSPNTVSPHLDAWFEHLGGRIKDPGAFSKPPAEPDEIQQLAKHFWERALATAREQALAQFAEAQRSLEADRAALAIDRQAVEDEKRQLQIEADSRHEAMALARAQHEDARQRLVMLDALLQDQARELSHVREREAQARAEVGRLQQQLEVDRSAHERERTELQDRAAARERHWTLEVDRAREAAKAAVRQAKEAAQQAEAASHQVSELKERVQQLERALAKARGDHRLLSQELAVAHERLAAASVTEQELKAQAQQSQAQVNGLLDRMAKKDQELSETRTHLMKQRGGRRAGRTAGLRTDKSQV